jgi:beta propeller repeat protein
MEKHTRLGLALLLLAAVAAVPAAGLLAGTETQVTMGAGDQCCPVIWGDYIVWEDSRNGNWDIYLYDLGTGTETPICTDPVDQWNHPAIWRNHIVWVKNGTDIYLYDISTKTRRSICTEPANRYNPVIWEDRIAWMDDRNGTLDIYMYNISTGIEMQVTNGPSNHFGPAIWGDRIIWMDKRSENVEIYLYNISTGTETLVCEGGPHSHFPSIWGDRIVWRNGSEVYLYEVYIYDISTGTETQGCTVSGYQDYVSIWGDRIVYTSRRDLNWNIYLYDIGTGTEALVCTAFGYRDYSSIWENRIVWMDERNGNMDIYLFEIAAATELKAAVDLKPDTLSLRNREHTITAFIELPAGCDPAEIDASSCRLDSLPIAAGEPSAIGDYDGDGTADLMVTFDLCTAVPGTLDRQAILSLFRTVKVGRMFVDVTVTVSGEMNDGTPFSGEDTIRIRV